MPTKAIKLTATQKLGKPCKHGHNGLRWKINNSCVECTRIRGRSEKGKKYYRKWAKENPQCQRKWRAANRDRVMLMCAKDRAKRDNIPLNIDISDVVIPLVCPVFGTEFDAKNIQTKATLDRVIPELGYTKGNVRVISSRANRLKSDMTKSDLLRLLAYMEEE